MTKLIAILPLMVLSACAVGPDYQQPATQLPDDWQRPVEDASYLDRWWDRFGDPQLTAYIEESLAQNHDLKVAMANVDIAAAALRRSRSAFYPGANLTVDATRSKTSGNASFPMPTEPDTEFRAGLGVVSYELDIWGRVRRANEAALAELAADTAVMHGVRSSLAANVAQVYFQTLALDRQLALLNRLHATRSDNEQLQKLRLDSGLISPYDYEQARSETAAVAAQLPGLRESRRQALTALAVLRGATPEAMFIAWASPQDLTEFSLPEAPAVPMDLPSDMLARRPDVIAAEQRLIAANARIGVAKADYFPRLSLGGFFGGLSTSFSTLDADSSRNWNAAVAASVPLTNLREIGTRVDSATAATEAAAASYAGAVQLAFQEALNALGTVESTSEVRTAQQHRVTALENAYRISTARYDVGRIGYLELLDVERQLRQIEQQQVEAQLAQLQATVDLYRALGGGW